ncbi:hypothetical protein [Paenibacillus xylaniclasticus]|uniref:hypothetical protein n=1 Tax=Paenibacillus xylaniclasticus TaxID=588083 RepID=UPI0013DF576E|nr:MULTISPECIES: hypothetical protein [Paenibacillus]
MSLVILWMTIVAAPIIDPERAYACSCAVASDIEEALDNHAAVFAGKVTKLDKGSSVQRIQSSADKVEVVFLVDKVWKGELSEETNVSTVRSEASCGYTFSDNISYLVFAYEDKEGNLHTGLCSGNMLLSEASTQIQQLDAIHASYEPIAEAAAAPGEPAAISVQKDGGVDSIVYWIGAIVVIMIILGGIGLGLVKGRRRKD